MKGKVITVRGNIVTLKVEGVLKPDEIVTIKTGEPRTVAMNNLYWEMLEIVQSGTGHSKDELHELFKHEFLGDKIEVLGEPFTYSRSTTKLSIKEFSKYLSDIRRYVYEHLGFDLPLD